MIKLCNLKKVPGTFFLVKRYLEPFFFSKKVPGTFFFSKKVPGTFFYLLVKRYLEPFLKIMTKIYLISPPKIELKSFSKNLEEALQTGLVPVFQLRLKDCEKNDIKKIATELKKICADNNVVFLLNDDWQMALDIGASGVHLGADDGSIALARKNLPQNFVIGASCYDSRHLAMEAAEAGADYISFGAFFESKTKQSRGKPTTEILEWASEIMNLPIVAIGGITNENAGLLANAGADFVAVISYVWGSMDVKKAVKELNLVLK